MLLLPPQVHEEGRPPLSDDLRSSIFPAQPYEEGQPTLQQTHRVHLDQVQVLQPMRAHEEGLSQPVRTHEEGLRLHEQATDEQAPARAGNRRSKRECLQQMKQAMPTMPMTKALEQAFTR